MSKEYQIKLLTRTDQLKYDRQLIFGQKYISIPFSTPLLQSLGHMFGQLVCTGGQFSRPVPECSHLGTWIDKRFLTSKF